MGEFLDGLVAKLEGVSRHVAWGAAGFIAGVFATWIV